MKIADIKKTFENRGYKLKHYQTMVKRAKLAIKEDKEQIRYYKTRLK